MAQKPTGSAKRIIDVAKGEVGYREGRSNGYWNNKQKFSPAVPSLEWSQNQAWCATFVAWCAQEAGLKGLYPVTASCDVAGNWFRARGRWSEYPAVGAQVFFGTSADLNHTGIVADYDETYIYTIEGNTNDSGSREGNGVYDKTRRRRDAHVVGYGYPDFKEGIISADPKWAAKKPRPEAPAAKPATPKPAQPPVGLVKRTRDIPKAWHKFAHLSPYCKNNSFTGLQKAVDLGYTAIDLDFQVTKDGVIICTHWGDTREFEKKPRKFADLTWREVSKLRALRGGYRIRTMAAMFARAKKVGIKRIEFEAKEARSFEGASGVAIFTRVKKHAEKRGLKVQVKTISSIPHAAARLTAAKAADLTTIILPRGTRRLSKAKYWEVTDFVRGRVWWTR